MLKKIVMLACLAGLLAACSGSKKVSQDVAAQNEVQLKQCLADREHCRGGFVKWTNGSIVRIMDCDSGCQFGEIGLISIKIKMAAKDFPAFLESVVLPVNKAEWERMSVDYARQFVSKEPVVEKSPG